jgi:hypothetical protein
MADAITMVRPILTELLDEAVRDTPRLKREELDTFLREDDGLVRAKVMFGDRSLTAHLSSECIHKSEDLKGYIADRLQLDVLVGMLTIGM